nr:ABC transporter substrate-binding protein [Pseudomonas congelans]
MLINHEADVNWIDFYYSPHIGVSRKDIEHLGMNPLGRFRLEETVKK